LDPPEAHEHKLTKRKKTGGLRFSWPGLDFGIVAEKGFIKMAENGWPKSASKLSI
jgi:hypothetical protein